jgi:hypothetical protein
LLVLEVIKVDRKRDIYIEMIELSVEHIAKIAIERQGEK